VRVFWPDRTSQHGNLIVRIGRSIHWLAVGTGVFGLVISFYAMLQAGDRLPLPYVAVGLVWVAIAMIGRALRYVIAKE
jgi:hypothetical protein